MIGDRGLGAGAGDRARPGQHAVNQMDQVTQQNAAMVEQSTAASHALAQETEELGHLTGRFQLGKDERGKPAPVPLSQHRPGNVAVFSKTEHHGDKPRSGSAALLKRRP